MRASDLLRKLGSGVRPDGAGEVSSGLRLAGAGFAGWLKSAAGGVPERGIKVESRVEAPLTDEQKARLAKTAESVLANGGSRALVRIDGEAVVLDAERGTVERSVEVSPGTVVSGIDSYTEARAAETPPERVQVPATKLSSASLIRVAMEREGPQDAG